MKSRSHAQMMNFSSVTMYCYLFVCCFVALTASAVLLHFSQKTVKCVHAFFSLDSEHKQVLFLEQLILVPENTTLNCV